MTSFIDKLRKSSLTAATRGKVPSQLRKKLSSAEIKVARTQQMPAVRLLPDNAPISPVGTVFKTLELLSKHDAWWDMLMYVERLSDETMEDVKIQVFHAIALLKLKEINRGIDILANVIPNFESYRAHPGGMALFVRFFDTFELIDMVVGAYKITPENRNVMGLVAVLLWSQKEFDRLENFQDKIGDLFPTDSAFALFCSRVSRKNNNPEKAAEFAFKACKLDPSDLETAILGIEIATNIPSDVWIDDALGLVDNVIDEIEHSKMAGRAVTAIAKLSARLGDGEKVLWILEKLATIRLTTLPHIFVISRSFFNAGQLDRCFEVLESYLAEYPGNLEIVRRMAGVFADQAMPAEGMAFIEANIPANKRDTHYYALIGHIAAWADMLEEARPILKKALELDPQNYSAMADLAFCDEQDWAYTLANSLMEQASVQMSIKQRQQTMGLNTMHLNRIRRRMIFVNDAAGNNQMARALINEAIIRNPLILPYPITENSGGDATGKKAIVLAELGVGDELRYSCVYKRKLAACSSVLLTCDPRLQTLLARSFPAFDVVPVLREFPGIKARRLDARKLATDNATRKVTTDAVIETGRDADVWIRAIHQFEIDALAHPFYQSPDEPVLVSDPARRAEFRTALDAEAKGRRVVGLSWRGGRQTYNRTPHYFRIAQWAPLLEDTDACFVNLQYGVSPDELEYLRDTLGDRFIEFPDLDLFDDMEGIAALCSEIDLVVAICTNVLEMAAGIGTQTLYLMRSPQATHAIRLHGDTDRYGTQQDSVWKACRIIPRFRISDETLIDMGRTYLQAYLSGLSKPKKAAAKTRKKKA